MSFNKFEKVSKSKLFAKGLSNHNLMWASVGARSPQILMVLSLFSVYVKNKCTKNWQLHLTPDSLNNQAKVHLFHHALKLLKPKGLSSTYFLSKLEVDEEKWKIGVEVYSSTVTKAGVQISTVYSSWPWGIQWLCHGLHPPWLQSEIVRQQTECGKDGVLILTLISAVTLIFSIKSPVTYHKNKKILQDSVGSSEGKKNRNISCCDTKKLTKEGGHIKPMSLI